MEDDESEHALFDEIYLLPPSSPGQLTSSTDNQLSCGNIHSVLAGTSPRWLPINDNLPLARAYPNSRVIDKIEAVLEGIVNALLHDRDEIIITLKCRQRASSQQSEDLAAVGDISTTRLSFPGKTADEAWRFSVVLRILGLMHEALRTDVVISKRDMYYRDPALFGSQAHVDRYVDDIALTFDISRSQLNVAAAAKGLVAGALTFCRRDGSTADASIDRDGVLVPNLRDILSVRMPNVRWILVIEKEASFRSIAASRFWDIISSEGIILTGKGYPDLGTRALLHFLGTSSVHNGFMEPVIHGLADFDPDGISILSTYKHGSKALAHGADNHVVPQLRWLGMHSAHLQLAGSDTQATQGLLVLTKRDRQKAVRMLECSERDNDVFGAAQRQELQAMLMLNSKAELQLLDSEPNGMSKLLVAEICGKADFGGP